MAVLFVTHDLAAARVVADRIAVMYLGAVVECGPADLVAHDPVHPYTTALLAAIPSPGTAPVRLSGEPASPLAVPSGCSFHPRCPERVDRCATDEPILYSLDGTSSRFAACLLTEANLGKPGAGRLLAGVASLSVTRRWCGSRWVRRLYVVRRRSRPPGAMPWEPERSAAATTPH